MKKKQPELILNLPPIDKSRSKSPTPSERSPRNERIDVDFNSPKGFQRTLSVGSVMEVTGRRLSVETSPYSLTKSRSPSFDSPRIDLQKQTSPLSKSPRATINLDDPTLLMIDGTLNDSVKAFNNFDKTNNGTIDASYLYETLSQIYPNLTIPECQRVYLNMDKSRQGIVTLNEFIKAVQNIESDTEIRNRHNICGRNWEIPHEEITLQDTIGQGMLGRVYKGKWKGTSVAIKAGPNLSNLVHLDSLMKNIFKYKHPNLITFIGASIAPSNTYYICELIENGSIYDCIYKRNVAFSAKTILHILLQVAQAVSYLHSQQPPVIIRDLKSTNILITEQNYVYLSDFGVLSLKPKNDEIIDKIGLPYWIAPELLVNMNNDKITEKVDVYSFGVLFYELTHSQIPFVDCGSMDRLILTVAHNGKRPKFQPKIPTEFSSLIKSCWDTDPKKRPSFNDITSKLEKLYRVYNTKDM